MQDDFLLSWCTNEQQFLLSQKRNEDEKCVCMTANTEILKVTSSRKLPFYFFD